MSFPQGFPIFRVTLRHCLGEAWVKQLAKLPDVVK